MTSRDEESTRRPSQESEKYRLYFMTPNTKDRIHSQFNNLKSIRAVSDRPRVSVHPRDADSRDIQDGDRVRIYNDRGSLEVEARLDHGIKPGCVSVTNGWWISGFPPFTSRSTPPSRRSASVS